MRNGRRGRHGGSGPTMDSSACSWAPWSCSSWRSISSIERCSAKRRGARRAAGEHGQAEAPERRVEPWIATKAVEPVVDGHERHLVIVLGDREFQVFEGQVLFPEL